MLQCLFVGALDPKGNYSSLTQEVCNLVSCNKAPALLVLAGRGKVAADGFLGGYL